MPIIEIKNVSYSYNRNPVLDNISFTINVGDYVGIIGPNGGGKTTLLKIILGLIKPDSGLIKIFGSSIHDFSRWPELGYIPQHAVQENLFFPATVYEIVTSGLTPILKLFTNLMPNHRDLIENALNITHITHLRDRLLNNLSGGERQRVYVARALVRQPKILILDEPFVGIDVANQREFYAILKDINIRQKTTIMFVSHDVDVISLEVKKILCLNHRLVCEGSPKNILENQMIKSLYGTEVTHLHHHYDNSK